MELHELKVIGHMLIENYIKSHLRVENDKRHYNKEKRKAYHLLAQNLHADVVSKGHFRNMTTEDEVVNAIYVLYLMINDFKPKEDGYVQ